ncbi:galactoside alpha-(1,2)-fucosyltransferase 2 isoform X1 [Patella vulgata]|uniref:galactoside alpha-(1,2)-fucosyltransferase 2 isoform X1 n=1 Tax=Patella vulgata TaxID=6465 RepID=UPI00217FCAB2|nr:galactoside alpha-(1,2)-fucosyltransferase 2 isoform X1 [Patella vulgata]XP_050407445.1 galactoside alpha-(1,2)-fucosyltransferase 2 isoform X1 [Patella vulgata]XP_050407460.1 galactoside alpha-(1,2)-fucosyltransferase 2 isoform X1 [Patella vulgata]XP_050407461.1 galactoside alpha-(1,2)-fucosyltransferase 2 isoform X1 [Patella vulgata]
MEPCLKKMVKDICRLSTRRLCVGFSTSVLVLILLLQIFIRQDFKNSFNPGQHELSPLQGRTNTVVQLSSLLHKNRTTQIGNFLQSLPKAEAKPTTKGNLGINDLQHSKNEKVQMKYNLNHSNIICPTFHGGLGNNLFQYAAAYGLARRLNADVVLTPNTNIYQFFQPVARISTDPNVCSKVKIITERHAAAFDESFFNLSPGSDYKFIHYLQSWKYFKHVEAELRHQFIFRGDVIARARSQIANKLERFNVSSKMKPNVLVNIHVRRGNYLIDPFATFGYKVANMTYINKAKKYFTDKYENVTFFVFSNDMKWCKENIKGLDIVYIENNSREIDLAIMSLLNHTIITVGTFGYWAAWLCNGETVYFADLAKPGSEFAQEFSADKKDYFYPGWIGM